MIEYTHPGLTKPITIDLQQGYYIDGNEILSDLFIARYLQYHHGPNIFKNDYNLSIMDNKFKIINLNHNSRITIKKNDYTVIDY
jgi:hypothetical protein